MNGEIVPLKVTFVVYEGEVVALFRASYVRKTRKWTPCCKEHAGWIPAYAHNGQHTTVGSCLLDGRRATVEEYLLLLAEMERTYGYDVIPVHAGPVDSDWDGRTAYAVLWTDSDGDTNVVRTFRSRETAVEYATADAYLTLLGMGAKALDPDTGYKTELPIGKIRDVIASGDGAQLSTGVDAYGEPTGTMFVRVSEVSID